MKSPYFLGAGGIVSADIAVPNHEQELSFYSSVLTTGENPLWREDLMNNLGTPIIGLGERTPEYESLPLQWTPHFQVADIAASVAKAIELGGMELMHGKNEAGESLWAGVTDPSGAALGLIPEVPKESEYAKPDEPFGHIAWLSLAAADASSSRDFYEQVIGWKGRSVNTDDSPELARKFDMFVNDETAAAEIVQLADQPEDVPSVWLLHLPVGDLAASIQQVKDAGGKVVSGSVESKSVIVRDPIGVCFALQSA